MGRIVLAEELYQQKAAQKNKRDANKCIAAKLGTALPAKLRFSVQKSSMGFIHDHSDHSLIWQSMRSQGLEKVSEERQRELEMERNWTFGGVNSCAGPQFTGVGLMDNSLGQCE